MKTLIAGANIALPSSDVVLTFHYQLSHGECDLSAYLLSGKTGKVRGDGDMIFYGQKSTENYAVALDFTANQSTLTIKTHLLDAEIEKIAICATIDKAENFSVLQSLDFHLKSAGKVIASAQELQKDRSEAALILAEIYRYKDMWKCRWFMQGFYHFHLQELAEHFGVEIADESEETTSSPPSPPISQSQQKAKDELPPPPDIISL